jgi:uncharacterized membrane protein
VLTSLLVGVIGMNVLALALVLARGPAFGTRVYRPMLVNLALSAAPLALLGIVLGGSALLEAHGPTWPAVAVAAVLGVVWLLLLPNSGYLVTELNLSHRREGEEVPMWYDVVLVVSLAMSGVLNTVLGVFVVQFEYVLLRYGDGAAPLESAWARVLVAVILLLVALGMYLGRYVRLNSWDVRHPSSLVRKVTGHLHDGGAVPLVAFTVLYAAFFGLMYLVVIGPVIGGLVAAESH